MDETTFDLAVIGAGPGGYVAAIRAAQLGMKTACIDANAQLGGTCLRVGCIPSKALLESSEKLLEATRGLARHGVKTAGVELDLAAMMKRKDDVVATLCRGIEGLFKKHAIRRFHGRGRLEGPGKLLVEGPAGRESLSFKNCLIAAGSTPAPLPGVELDGDRIGTSTEALAYGGVPKHLVVIGAGYIGLELGSVWKRLGARVTVLEALDRILPGTDAEIAGQAQRILKRQGLEFHLGTRVQRAYVQDDRCRVEREGLDPIECDRVLLAVGRRANTDGLGLDALGIERDRAGRIEVDEHFATAAEGVYAVGDCIGGAMLAHKASDEAVACVERIASGYGHVNYDAIPAVVYTHPEIASVGKTEEALQQEGRAYRKGAFPFVASGRARTLGETDGLVKILAEEETDRILGVHVLGVRAGDLIAEATVAMELGATSEDLARISHAHPTLAEAVHEAALAVDGRPLHM